MEQRRIRRCYEWLGFEQSCIHGSIAQLGVGIGGTAGSASARIEERIGIPIPTETATLRYPVHEADLGDQTPGVSDLTVRYRDGNGSVIVHLIQVAVDTGVETARRYSAERGWIQPLEQLSQ